MNTHEFNKLIRSAVIYRERISCAELAQLKGQV